MEGETFNIDSLFYIICNNEKRQFEFDPKAPGWSGYIVSYDDENSIEDAKIAVYLAIKAQGSRKKKF
jgi:hypothetical protein